MNIFVVCIFLLVWQIKLRLAVKFGTPYVLGIPTLANGGKSKGESGVYRLMHTVCRSVQEKGCEKSGRMMQFKSRWKDRRRKGQARQSPNAKVRVACFADLSNHLK